MEWLTWLLIPVCLSQSAMFSGLNLSLMSISRLQLEVDAAGGDRRAERVLHLRDDPHLLLTTILLGNVAVNVLLAILADHVMAAAAAFVFSTFVITYLGEIFPQAFFSRYAVRVGSALFPLVKFYQFLLYPIAKPTALLLGYWLGKEAIPFLEERGVRELIKQHIRSDETNISYEEGVGALNFLALDDIAIKDEGEPIDPASMVSHDTRDGKPNLPLIPADAGTTHPFVQQVAKSGHKWVILIDETGQPDRVLNADSFLRAVLMSGRMPANGANVQHAESDGIAARHVDPSHYCHAPVMVTDHKTPLGHLLRRLKVEPEHPGDDVIDNDVVLLWSDDERRILTGADLLGRLLRGIAVREAI